MPRTSLSAIHLICGRFAAKCHNFRPEKRHFSRVPTIDFSSIRDANDAMILFREMLKMSPQPTAPVYCKLLGLVAKMEEYSVALSMFDEMRQLGFAGNEYIMTIAINCSYRLNQVDLGFAILGSLLKHGYEPNVLLLNTLLKGLFLAGKVSEAEAFFRKVMTLKYCQLDDVMIVTLIDGLCKVGEFRTVRYMLSEIAKTGWKQTAQSSSIVIHFNILLDAFCKQGMMKEAEDVFQLMVRLNVSPDIFTCNIILKGLCKNRRIDEALSFLSMMESKGDNPNKVSYVTLIDGLCRTRNIGVARDIFSQLTSKGLQPDVQIYSMIIASLFREGLDGEAKSMLDEMRKRGCEPNGVTYNVIIHRLRKRNEIRKAMLFLGDMYKRGFSVDSTIASALFDQIAGEGKEDNSVELLNHDGGKE